MKLSESTMKQAHKKKALAIKTHGSESQDHQNLQAGGFWQVYLRKHFRNMTSLLR